MCMQRARSKKPYIIMEVTDEGILDQLIADAFRTDTFKGVIKVHHPIYQRTHINSEPVISMSNNIGGDMQEVTW